MLNEMNPKKETIVFGNDSITIVKYEAGLPGGRTLDVSGWPDENILAGTVIVRTDDGVYKPLGIVDGAYKALATEVKGEDNKVTTYAEKYAGVLYRSIPKARPEAAIMVAGVVNSTLLPAPLPTGFLSSIVTVTDEVA